MQDKTILTVNQLELMGFLVSNGTACRFVSLLTKTPVVKIRTGNPWGASAKTKKGLYKVSKKRGLINLNYVAAVERRIANAIGVPEEIVEYIPDESWHKHVRNAEGNPSPVVLNAKKDDGKMYLMYHPQGSENHYVNEAGEVVPEETVKPWLYAESPRSDIKPPTITIELKNVLQMKASGCILGQGDVEEAKALFAAA